MARRKRLILAEFVVTVWEDRIDWDGVDRLICELLHAKPVSSQLRAVYRRRNLRSGPSK